MKTSVRRRPVSRRAHPGFVELLEARIAPATFSVLNNQDSGAGSLRDAITQANDTPNNGGPDVISFANISATGSFVIELQSALPVITDAIIINGYSAPNASVNTAAIGTNAVLRVMIDGSDIIGSGLVLGRDSDSDASGSAIRGLALAGFHTGIGLNGFGILIQADNVTVAGNFIGTDLSGNQLYAGTDSGGMTVTGNSNAAVGIFALTGTDSYTGITIGGAAPAARNILSGSAFGALFGVQAASSFLQGNLIGTDRTGFIAIPNFNAGVAVAGSAITIGGATDGSKNVISGNNGEGIDVGTGVGTSILGNIIGLNAAGSIALPNSGPGIRLAFNTSGVIVGGTGLNAANTISGNLGYGIEVGSSIGDGAADNVVIQANRIGTNTMGSFGVGFGNGLGGIGVFATSSTTIGGVNPGEGNVIANNVGAGINVLSDAGATIRGNAIFDNDGLGIDLKADGVTTNDFGDGDTGANGLQNFPFLTNATFSSFGASIAGALNSTANTTFFIDFYADSAADASGYGEGSVYLGGITVTTDAEGNVTFDFTTPTSPLTPGILISAVATNQATGSSSEFSAVRSVGGVYVWDGGAGTSDWADPLNWDLDAGVPGTFDTAILNLNATIDLGSVPQTVARFQQSAGTFTGLADLTITDSFIWTGGAQAGTGTTLVDHAANLTITGLAVKTLDRRALSVTGTANWSGPGNLSFENDASLSLAGSATITSNFSIVDTSGGSFSIASGGKLEATGLTANFGVPLTNEGEIFADADSTTLNFNGGFLQLAGLLEVGAGAAVGSTSPLLFDGGFLRGIGTIIGSVDNAGGTVQPGGTGSAGRLLITGSYTHGVDATLEVELGGISAAEVDLLEAGSFATLNGGTLRGTLLSGFTPPPGTTFNVLGSDGLTGTFVNTELPQDFTQTLTLANVQLVSPAGVSAIVVDTTLDVINSADGLTSLREAILFANSNPGTDLIQFAIPGSGAQVIALQSALPEITDDVFIDGYSQPGASANTLASGTNATPLIVLDGLNLLPGSPSNGLVLAAGSDGSTISGLVIKNFRDDSGGGGGNGLVIFSANNIVSGNLVTGNEHSGILVFGANNLLGGSTLAARNLISGNEIGIDLQSSGATGNIIQGNLIGTDATGAAAQGNSLHGVYLSGGASGNFIGGAGTGAGNLISSNGLDGIRIDGAATNGNTIQGNLIGLNATGTAALGNGSNGILLINSPSNTTIGGDDASDGASDGVVAARNFIAGNLGGIFMVTSSGSAGTVIKGNYLGTDITGSVAVGNVVGLQLDGSGHTVGGTTAGAGNLISGQTSFGMVVQGSAHVIQGNRIGTNAAGTAALGNGDAGINVSGGSDLVIGGTAAGAGNIIANTVAGLGNGAGVVVLNGFTGVSILGNSIYANAGPGIDLGGDGPTANDADDADTGSNNLLNSPALTEAVLGSAAVEVTGSLVTDVTGTVRIEFFKADADGSEGRTLLGFLDLNVVSGEAASFAASLPSTGVAAGDRIVATTTHSGMGHAGTSEFSGSIAAIPSVLISIGDAAVVEGPGGTTQIVFKVTLDQAVPTGVVVDFATSDFSSDARNATAGIDYQALAGQVIFSANQLSQTITITINGDTLAEPRERFLLTLSNAQGAVIGKGVGSGIIQDDDHRTFAVGEGSGNSFSVFTSSSTGSTLVETIDVFAANFKGGVRVAVGDVTGDGVDDFIAGGGSGSRAKVRVFDGTTFAPVAGPLGDLSAFGGTYRGGVFVASGDVDGDGHDDVIVTPSAGSSNAVMIYSGADGTLLNSFRAFSKGTGGVRVATGDVDGDGFDDVVVGTGVGSGVRAYDGTTGALIASATNQTNVFGKAYRGGVYVAAGDLDMDGKDDLIVSAGAKTPQVRTYLQSDPTVAAETFEAYGGRTLRGVRVGILDVTGDGIADIIASKGRGGDNLLHVIDGSTRQALFTLKPLSSQSDGIYVG